MGAFETFVNANLGIRKPLILDLGPPASSEKAAGIIGSHYIDTSSGFIYEKTGDNNFTDWAHIRNLGDNASLEIDSLISGIKLELDQVSGRLDLISGELVQQISDLQEQLLTQKTFSSSIELSQGVDSLYIDFNQIGNTAQYSTPPQVACSMRYSSRPSSFYQYSTFNVSTSGCEVLFSDNIFETGAYLDVIINGSEASTGLTEQIVVTEQNGEFYFNGEPSSSMQFDLSEGSYTFSNISEDTGFTFHTKDKPVDFGGTGWAGEQVALDGNLYDYYHGDVILKVTGDFDTMSYQSKNKGYMGGQDNLKFKKKNIKIGNGFKINIDYSGYTEQAFTDEDKLIIRSAANVFEKIILNNGSHTINMVNFSEVESAPAGVLAYAYPVDFEINSATSTAKASSSNIAIDSADLSTLRSSVDYETALYWTVLHEIAHGLGVGTLWNYRFEADKYCNDFITLDENNGAQYSGVHAVRQYNKIFNTNFASLPIQTFQSLTVPSSSYKNRSIPQLFSKTVTEQDLSNGYILHNDPWRPDDFSIEVPIDGAVLGESFSYTIYLTWGGHIAELSPDSLTSGRQLNGELQPLIVDELMTPYSPIFNHTPLTKITIGLLADLGFAVEYSKVYPSV